MRLSKYFLPILRDDPKEAEIVSHRLMLRAGMIRQESAGIYSWLPLGYKVLRNIERIVREEQNRAGAIEVLMPTIQSADLWRKSGRYDDYGKEMLRITDRHDRDMLFGPTNEEMITDIFRAGVQSYKDVPRNLYHIQWKFRDEVRPRFGIMRGREVTYDSRRTRFTGAGAVDRCRRRAGRASFAKKKPDLACRGRDLSPGVRRCAWCASWEMGVPRGACPVRGEVKVEGPRHLPFDEYLRKKLRLFTLSVHRSYNPHGNSYLIYNYNYTDFVLRQTGTW